MKKNVLPVVFSVSLLAAPAFSQTDVQGLGYAQLEEMFIIGSEEDFQTLAGSGSLVDEEALKKFESSDINDVLTQVPGVYIRFEDGYGLRPNIGIRGVTSDRSQKITIMEDGILVAPSPYSAPSSYYFPNVARMHAVELVKGPAAIQNGPHTIGGSLNLVSRHVPDEASGSLALSYGSDNYRNVDVWYGNQIENWGFLVEGLHYGADGFKALESGADTGFERNDVNVKLQWQSDSGASLKQLVKLKLGYAEEVSDETYLGLSDADFSANPKQRYAASQQDQFESEHSQVHLLYSLSAENHWKFQAKAYTQAFDRAWNKFDGFVPTSEDEPAIPPQYVLANPDVFPNLMQLLKGELDTDGNPALYIDVTNNDRRYGSSGVDLRGELSLQSGDWMHDLSVGLRLHHDFVERHHQPAAYAMQGGEMILDSGWSFQPKALNEASTDALALFINDEISIADLTLNLGVRFENIDGEYSDALNDSVRERSQTMLTPGLGLYYQYNDGLGLILGVYQGFSPAAPSAAETVDPEQATNYEYGFRYNRGEFQAEVIGFFSDYSNLIGRCRASDSGCEPGDEFNGGEVQVAGWEITAGSFIELANHFSLPVNLVYTYTESAFQSSFLSGFTQWGRVDAGDELPYLPKNQLRFETGLQAERWRLDFALKYVDKMREVPGQGDYEDGRYTPAYTTVDLAAVWQLSDALELKLIGENLTEELVVVSRRPFGARPNQPRMIKAVANWSF